MDYRNEIKFEINEYDLERIKHRLLPLMKIDEHQGENGYTVRSLYFDDIYDSNMNENEAGISERKKYRIRIYNGSLEKIYLEKKSKYRGMTSKISQEITREECDSLLYGDADSLYMSLLQKSNLLLWEIYIGIMRKRLMPKCIVEYDRYAFVTEFGNTRITLDKNISGSNRLESFYMREINRIPVMPSGIHLLEVKYNELLPHYILQAIDIGKLCRKSYSKYYSVRKSLG